MQVGSAYSGREEPSESAQLQGVLEAILLLFIYLLKELPARWNVLILEETVSQPPPRLLLVYRARKGPVLGPIPSECKVGMTSRSYVVTRRPFTQCV